MLQAYAFLLHNSQQDTKFAVGPSGEEFSVRVACGVFAITRIAQIFFRQGLGTQSHTMFRDYKLYWQTLL